MTQKDQGKGLDIEIRESDLSDIWMPGCRVAGQRWRQLLKDKSESGHSTSKIPDHIMQGGVISGESGTVMWSGCQQSREGPHRRSRRVKAFDKSGNPGAASQ
jgi:hypothetical protein